MSWAIARTILLLWGLYPCVLTNNPVQSLEWCLWLSLPNPESGLFTLVFLSTPILRIFLEFTTNALPTLRPWHHFTNQRNPWLPNPYDMGSWQRKSRSFTQEIVLQLKEDPFCLDHSVAGWMQSAECSIGGGTHLSWSRSYSKWRWDLSMWTESPLLSLHQELEDIFTTFSHGNKCFK